MSAVESPQQPGPQTGWSFWIDRGGTFTDLVGRAPDGELVVRKVLSQQPERAGDPAVAAMRELLGLVPGQPLPSGAVSEVRIGTTVATNALLEDRGAATLLLISSGFADAAWIGDQHRPDLFALHVERPAPRYRRVLEVAGRLAADGTELMPLVLDAALERALVEARSDGISSCAVALLHSARHPRHERQLAEWLMPFGFEPVVLSHQVGRRTRLVPRAQTAVVEAMVAPALAEYLDQLRAELGPHCRLRVMQSSGGLVAPELLKAKDTILSGPAGGMVAAVRLAGGSTPIVGFDMGGTSTDVFHVEAGGPSPGWGRRQDTEIAGLTLQAEMLPIHTVAAGGGSLLHFDGQRLQVGPASAGADPGPACYRRGGPLTITDANLLLGRLQPQAFPAVFGPDRDQGPDPGVVRRGFQQLAEQVGQASGTSITPEATGGRCSGDCHRADGGGDPAHLDPAGPRSARRHAGLLRRGRRPARLCPGRAAGHGPGAAPSPGGGVLGLWHRSGRPALAAAGGGAPSPGSGPGGAAPAAGRCPAGAGSAGPGRPGPRRGECGCAARGQ